MIGRSLKKSPTIMSHNYHRDGDRESYMAGMSMSTQGKIFVHLFTGDILIRE